MYLIDFHFDTVSLICIKRGFLWKRLIQISPILYMLTSISFLNEDEEDPFTRQNYVQVKIFEPKLTLNLLCFLATIIHS